MLKKLLSLLLICLLLTAPLAAALDFDPSAYTKEELEHIFAITGEALEETAEEADPNAAYENKANLLYEDDYIALRFLKFYTKRENGPCATITFYFLNKFNDPLEFTITEAQINGVSVSFVNPQFWLPNDKLGEETNAVPSSIFNYSIDLVEEDLLANGIEDAQTLALTFTYHNEDAGLSQEITTDTLTGLEGFNVFTGESAMPARMEKVSSAIEGMPGLLREDEYILFYCDSLTIENGKALLHCRLLNKLNRALNIRLRDVLLNGQLLSEKELEILPLPFPIEPPTTIAGTSFYPLLIHLSEDELQEHGIEEAETLALRFSYSDTWSDAKATISTGSVPLR